MINNRRQCLIRNMIQGQGNSTPGRWLVQTSHDISKCSSLSLLRPKQRVVFARKVNGATQADQTVNKQKRNKESLFVRSIIGPLAMETKEP